MLGGSNGRVGQNWYIKQEGERKREWQREYSSSTRERKREGFCVLPLLAVRPTLQPPQGGLRPPPPHVPPVVRIRESPTDISRNAGKGVDAWRAPNFIPTSKFLPLAILTFDLIFGAIFLRRFFNPRRILNLSKFHLLYIFYIFFSNHFSLDLFIFVLFVCLLYLLLFLVVYF